MKRFKSITQKLGHTKSYDFKCQTISEKVDDACSKKQTESGSCCLGHRHLVAFWCFFYFAMVNCHVSLISVAIVAMVNHTEAREMHQSNTSAVSCPLPTTTEDVSAKPKLEGPFNWNSQTQGQILGLSAFGYIFSNFLAGRVAEIMGAKRIILFSDFFVNICTIISPFAAMWSVYALIVLQIARGFFQGFIVPSTFVMMANWFPRSERGLLSSFAGCGSSFGALITSVGVGRLCDIPSLGWRSAFCVTAVYIYTGGTLAGIDSHVFQFHTKSNDLHYLKEIPRVTAPFIAKAIVGGCNLVVSIIFAFLFYEVPKNHPRISKEELQFIIGDQENDMSLKRPSAPWKKIFTSIPVYALIIGKFGFYWSIAHFLCMHPTFMGTILHFSMTENGIFSSMLFLIMAAGSIISMIASNWLRKKNYLGVNNLRKASSLISAIGFSICLVGVRLADCDKTVNMVFCGLAILFGGFGVCGTMIVNGDMSPTFSGSLSGITSAAACVATILVPLITGALTKHETLEEWHTVFYIHISVILICALIFQIFGSADIQPWDSVGSPESKTPVEQQPQTVLTVSASSPSRIHI